MKRTLFTTITTLMSAIIFAAEPLTIKLYPNGCPDSNKITAAEQTNDKGCISNITDPRIDVYLPEGADNATMILVCPGGGYQYASATNEGINVANFFNQQGIAIAVLKYRMPNGHCNIPLEDAQRAMEIIRDNAEQWNIDNKNIGVMGFSAGGHLASTVVTKYTSEKNRPDFGILVYPVITMDKATTHQGSRDNLLGSNPTPYMVTDWSTNMCVTADTPPCYIVANTDDGTVPVKNSLLFYEALWAHKVSTEMHIFPTGGHGWGFTRHFDGREEFEHSLLTWLAERR